MYGDYYTFPRGNLQILFRSVNRMNLNEILGHLTETTPATLAVLIALLGFTAIMYFAGKNAKWDTRSLAHAALCIALSYVLSCIRLYRFSFGGSITLLSMLPIAMCAMAQGPARGFVIGCAYGLLQLIQDFYVSHPMQLIMDYPLAFAMLGLAGLAKYLPIPERAKLPTGVVIAAAGRYLMHVISGAVFFGSYAAPGQTALAYSLIYNIGYMGPDAALCLIAACTPIAQKMCAMLKKR